MRRYLFIFSAVTIAACNSSGDNEEGEEKPMTFSTIQNMLTDEEESAGWQLLFDGTTTKGWHEYGKEVTGAAWKVVDGTLHLDASQKENGTVVGGGDILTDDEYENFDLKLEWKIDTGGNSGVIFYIHEDPAQYEKTYMSGPEMQVLDNERHPDAKIIKHRAGDLYDLISCSKETVKPALEWNQAEIRCVDGKLDFWLNGENVVSTRLWDDNWNKMVQASKFSEWPGFGTFKKGRIALQDHECNVWFRNIRIRKL